MAGHRPGRAGQSGRLNARAAPRRHLRTNIGSPGLCDRALIGLTGHRRGARHEVEDVYTKNRRVRLREKGGKRHAMPFHHNLEEYLTAYLDGAGLRDDPEGRLCHTIGRGTWQAHPRRVPQAKATLWAVVAELGGDAGRSRAPADSLPNLRCRAGVGRGLTAHSKSHAKLKAACRRSSPETIRPSFRAGKCLRSRLPQQARLGGFDFEHHDLDP
jgi:hypothetical protein